MTRQRKVATRTGVANSKHEKILTALSFFPEGTTPKTLARETGLNVNTVKAILPKLAGIKKLHRGFYKVVERGDSTLPSTGNLEDWNFHNLVLTAVIGGRWEPVDRTEIIGLIKCRVVISKAGNATLFVSSDWPLNVSSICIVFAYFRDMIYSYSEYIITLADVLVKAIEFNKDYSNLRLDDLRAITVDSLVEQFKIYQKKRGLRIEHKSKIPMPVENIVDMLRNNPNTLEFNVKLQEQQKQIERLANIQQKTNNILLNLNDYLKEVK